MTPLPARPKRKTRGPTILLSLLVAGIVTAASVAVATLVIQEAFTATPASHAPPVVFSAGDDASSLVTQGWLVGPTITASGAAASVTLYGVPGAISVSLGEIMELTNSEAAGGTSYLVTLSSSALPAGVTSMTLSFLDGATLRTWNLAGAGGSFTQYTMSPEEVWELSAVLVMPASGALSAITITATITPA
jgi:hypothetical protein